MNIASVKERGDVLEREDPGIRYPYKGNDK